MLVSTTARRSVRLLGVARLAAADAARQCIGCGAHLQVTDPAAAGYVPPSRLVTWSGASRRARERLASLTAGEPGEAPADEPVADIKVAEESMKLVMAPRSEFQELDPTLVTDDMAVISAGDIKKARRELKSATPRVSCQRCYHLSKYREVLSVSVTASDYEKVLRQIRERPALIVLVVDVLDFPGSLLSQLAATVGKHEVLLVGNKVDLLPTDARRVGLKHWLEGEAQRLLDTRIRGVHLVSARSGEGVDDLLKDIKESRGSRSVYIVGCANVGKSAVINQILRRDGRSSRTLTTSPVAGTTLNLVRFTLRDGTVVHDTPGLIPDKPLLHKYLTHEEMELVMPTKPFSAPMFSLVPGRSLLLGGLGRIDHVGPAPSVLLTAFVAPGVTLHVTRTDTVDYFVKKHMSSRQLRPPLPRDKFGSTEEGALPVSVPPMPPAEQIDFAAAPVVPHGSNSWHAALDVVFPGLGFVSVTVPPARATDRQASFDADTALRAFYPEGLGAVTRRPMLPYEAQKRGPKERGGMHARVYYKP